MTPTAIILSGIGVYILGMWITAFVLGCRNPKLEWSRVSEYFDFVVWIWPLGILIESE